MVDIDIEEVIYKELYELGCKDIEDFVELKCMEQPDINVLKADKISWEDYE